MKNQNEEEKTINDMLASLPEKMGAAIARQFMSKKKSGYDRFVENWDLFCMVLFAVAAVLGVVGGLISLYEFILRIFLKK